MSQPTPWQFQVFFDGQCPLCSREVAFLRRRDRRAAVRFTDISQAHFDPCSLGVELEALMGRIHGRLPDGQLVEGVEVFRRLYAAVGLGWVTSWTALPGISRLADWGYARFASNRLRLTGRCNSHGRGRC